MYILLLLLPLALCQDGLRQQSDFNQFNNNNLNNNFNNAPIGTMGDHKRLTEYSGNLVAHGQQFGDSYIADSTQEGRIINLHGFFPFYGGKYNYTIISTNGYIGFSFFTEQSGTFKVGTDVDWPTNADPAIMAPYLCRQRIDGSANQRTRIQYRVEKRGRTNVPLGFGGDMRPKCKGSTDSVYCDTTSEQFLDAMERALQEGVAGGSVFRADAALVVTWSQMRPNLGDEDKRATYQLVWVTDAMGHLSYSMINYQTLNYDAADMNGNSKTDRCQALFNGGNHTGTVFVDTSEFTKNKPSSLADRSAVPHVVAGRYIHRVDDVVRQAGCSNKTGGTHPLLVYPNIVNMLGQVTVDVNALCLDSATSYTLMIENRQSAPCEVLNPSIARCRLPKILDWGTKTVYFQPQGSMGNDEKAFVGFIYFVPPTFDPTRLDIGNVNQWYKNPINTQQLVKWYPRNFTQPLGDRVNYDPFDTSIYSVSLGLYVVGYKEDQDDTKKKFVPQHRVLAKIASFGNRAEDEYRFKAQVERVDLNRVELWMLSDWEREHELFSYRSGYLKLAPVPVGGERGATADHGIHLELGEGLLSAPISLHWIWPLANTKRLEHLKKEKGDDKEAKIEFVKEKSREMCLDWFEEDGALNNFIRETETNASCPCREEQAALDYGRFMPHPRCSKLFRDITCTETLGSSNCYMSAQNVRGSQVRVNSEGTVHENSFTTHYGQTCCYDQMGYLMQSSYQPVIKIDDSTPYSPGFPTRAYEHGTPPDIGMFEVPGLSTFHHDITPYYLCCKFTDFRCQLFYWRRPSSACQAYESPVTGSVMGSGVVSTLDGRSFVFNEPGVFTLLHAHKTQSTEEVQIQIRTERYPDRSVNFGRVEYNQDRVVPSNITVVTGVVLSSENSDKVHVLLRKDTYRHRYRTTIMVGNVVRYFDNMVIQRFRGVTVYVNNVNKGQSEVFVVLDGPQIGVRIRESYALDMDVTPQFFESPGLLDVTVSVPPQYKVQSSSHIHTSQRARVEGLLLPFPDQSTTQHYNGLLWSDVNGDGLRSALMRFKIGNIDSPVSINDEGIQDLFTTSSGDEILFQSFPDHFLKGPVYTPAAKYKDNIRNPFVPVTEQIYRTFIDFCKKTAFSEYQPEYERIKYRQCPKVEAMENACNGDVACLFDSTFLQSGLLGEQVKYYYHNYMHQRNEVVRHYNSCGAMNIEYPEYLIKGPSSAEKAYLEGDTLHFTCYQTHIVYGDSEYTCQKVPLHDNFHSDGQHDYMMRWTGGSQPWCRHRAKDNIFTWLQWTSVIFGVLVLVAIIFGSCWACKQKQKEKNMNGKGGTEVEMVPLNKPKPQIILDDSHFSQKPSGGFAQPGPGSSRYIRKTDTPSSEMVDLHREPMRRGSQSSLHQLKDDSFPTSQSTPRQGRTYQPEPPSYASRPSSSRKHNEISV